ncbi:hypothetical protein HD554DRAFT_2056365 [Boletus coccyginus]|nr:hypothetical protein HD554DRAFT_2056365 [Boletus coccyginus]
MKYTKFITKIRVGIWRRLHDMLEKGFGWAAANRGGVVVVSVVVVSALRQGGHASFLRPSWGVVVVVGIVVVSPTPLQLWCPSWRRWCC